MKTSRALVLTVPVLLLLVLVYAIRRKPTASSPFSATTNPKEPPRSAPARAPGFREPKKVDDAEVRALMRNASNDAKELKKAISVLNDKKGEFVLLRPGLPIDVPLLCLRFFAPAKDDKLVPLKIEAMQPFRYIDGEVVGGSQGELRANLDVNASIFISAVASAELSPDASIWRLGRTYYILFTVPGNPPNRPEWFEAVISVPRIVPKGEMISISVVADTPKGTLARKQHIGQDETAGTKIEIFLKVVD